MQGVEIPAAQNTTLEYPLALFGSDAAAKAFSDFLAGPRGMQVLQDAGFLAP